MRRLVPPILAYAAVMLVAGSCKTDENLGDCFESGATAYRVDLGADTSLTFRWPAGYMPVRYYAEPVGNLRANVDNYLPMWRGAFRCGELSTVRVTDSTVADVIIRNPTQMPPIPAAGLALLHGDSTGFCDARTDIEVDTVLNELTLPMRVYVAPADLDTARVNGCYRVSLAHEIGHTLGLFAHSTDTLDLMHGNPQLALLSINDRYTIQLLYHQVRYGLHPDPR